MDNEPPAHAIDWTGQDWTPGCGRVCAHANARFTAPAVQCPSIDPNWQNPDGVSLSAIVFGGRRASTMPLVYQSNDWNHGVYIGATMGSEMTAAAFGQLGKVRRDPMAMLPFCGYHVGDYFAHWIKIGTLAAKLPQVFHVNWFRKTAEGKWMWPGYGENMRVLEWIVNRCQGKATGTPTKVGTSPTFAEFNTEGIAGFTEDSFNAVMALDSAEWQAEIAGQEEFFASVGDKLPAELTAQRAALAARMA